MTSGSSHRPGIIPSVRICSSTAARPWVNRAAEGRQAPMLSHQSSPGSAYQPASMQKYSAPTCAAALISGSSRSVLGSPIRVFM